MFQRPQQMACAFARRGFNTVYGAYNTNYEPDASIRGLYKTSQHLYLFNDGYRGQSLDALRNSVVWLYLLNQSQFIRHLPKNRRIIYDWIDDLDALYYGNKKKAGDRHRRMLETADVVFASARKLYDEARAVRPDCVLLPNAGDYEAFAHPARQNWPELAELRQKSKVIVGYYGTVVRDHIDFDLIRSCARRFPDWTFLMVGHLQDGIAQYAGAPELKNIVLWGHQPYQRIPHLLSQLDIAIIPFLLNPIAQAASPVKLFEYMAGKKPIVTTDMLECRQYPGVLIGKSRDDFGNQLEQALKLRNDKEYLSLLDRTARENTWDKRVNKVIEVLRGKKIIA
jgi:glycosyltransferase involved in cell wall biosynthesis